MNTSQAYRMRTLRVRRTTARVHHSTRFHLPTQVISNISIIDIFVTAVYRTAEEPTALSAQAVTIENHASDAPFSKSTHT